MARSKKAKARLRWEKKTKRTAARREDAAVMEQLIVEFMGSVSDQMRELAEVTDEHGGGTDPQREAFRGLVGIVLQEAIALEGHFAHARHLGVRHTAARAVFGGFVAGVLEHESVAVLAAMPDDHDAQHDPMAVRFARGVHSALRALHETLHAGHRKPQREAALQRFMVQWGSPAATSRSTG